MLLANTNILYYYDLKFITHHKARELNSLGRKKRVTMGFEPCAHRVTLDERAIIPSKRLFFSTLFVQLSQNFAHMLIIQPFRRNQRRFCALATRHGAELNHRTRHKPT